MELPGFFSSNYTQDEKLKYYLDAAPVIFLALNSDGQIEMINRRGCALLGLSEEEAVGKPWFDTFVSPRQKEQSKVMFKSIVSGEHPLVEFYENEIVTCEQEVRTIRWHNALSIDCEGKIAGTFSYGEDMTEQLLTEQKLQESEHRLQQIAHYDPLTKLPNRLLLYARLEHAIERSDREGNKVALVHLDLDHFKDINESYGYGVGDKVLLKIAEKLHHPLRQEDTVARIGGDEFIILVENIADVLEMENILRKIRNIFDEVIVADGLDFKLTSSMGVAIYPDDGEDAETILKHADIAQHRSKESGGQGYCYFSAEMGAQVFERVLLEREMRRAVDEKEFTVYYQPQIDLTTGNLIGAEALVRWRHPMMGLVRPDVFISLAEHNHLIVPMGEQVLEEACLRAKEWIQAGLFRGRMSVNVSGRQFERKNVVETIREIVEKTGLESKNLELEITESVMMSDPKELMGKLFALKELGIEIAIDDFGTGYSSLSYLKQLPIDKLKIDQSFVRGLMKSEQDYAIVKAIIAMADILGLKTIAEGIEEKEQGEVLKKMGCMQGQGYWYARPLEKEAFEAYMKRMQK